MAGTSNENDRPRMLPSIPVGSPADRHLRESLILVRDQMEDRESREALTEIIEGRRDARELLRIPAFMALADRGVSRFEEEWTSLTDEERTRAADEAGSLLDVPSRWT
jgi:hypothetical protein